MTTESQNTSTNVEITEDPQVSIIHDYSKIVVCIDAGHAASTPGKRSPYSGYGTEPAIPFREYAWNREIAGMLAQWLEGLGFNVYMVTPETDEDVPLVTRYKRANSVKANNPNKKFVFVSIHSNAFGDGKTWTAAKGWSCYTTKGQNRSDFFAECLYDVAKEMLPPCGMSVRTDTTDGDSDYEENFTVIKGANMPAVLTENMFYTNVNDTRFLLSEQGKAIITEIHLKGITKFVESEYGC